MVDANEGSTTYTQTKRACVSPHQKEKRGNGCVFAVVVVVVVVVMLVMI
jgi:hypothetical protein